MPVRIIQSCLLVILLFVSGLSLAATYRFVDKDGTIWYTNKKLTQNGAVNYTNLEHSPKQQASISCVPLGHSEMNRRIQTLNPIISNYAKTFGVDDGLIHAIVSVESCYDANAVSHVGAQGLMQLMPKTAESLGVSDAFNPEENLRAGIEYFSKLSKRFDYNFKMALAAYNAGPTAVEKYAGIPPYKETRNYVDKVLKIYQKNLVSPARFKPASVSTAYKPH